MIINTTSLQFLGDENSNDLGGGSQTLLRLLKWLIYAKIWLEEEKFWTLISLNAKRTSKYECVTVLFYGPYITCKRP